MGNSGVSMPLELCDLECGDGVFRSLLIVLLGNPAPISIRLWERPPNFELSELNLDNLAWVVRTKLSVDWLNSLFMLTIER